MSGLDEGRYGKACLLVLKICPFSLRKVIDDFYIKQGSLSFQDFLERNKHDLFHIYKKACCCRSQQSRTSPMYKGQWELLYMRNGSPCTRGKRGDCPCQYDAKPGITTNVMDVTMCCLLINTICTGINLSHINTIREVRNNLIHSDNAGLDEPTYRQCWNRVKTAILDLAKHVTTTPTLYTETWNMMQELEVRMMNSDDLEELRKLIIDEKKFQDLVSDLSNITQNLSSLDETLKDTTQKMTLMDTRAIQTAQKITQIEDKATQMTHKMTQIEDTAKKAAHHVAHIDDRANQTALKISQIEDVANQTAQNVIQAQKNILQLETTVEHRHLEYLDIQETQLRPIHEDLIEHDRKILEHSRKIKEQSRNIQTQESKFRQEIAEIKHQFRDGEDGDNL